MFCAVKQEPLDNRCKYRGRAGRLGRPCQPAGGMRENWGQYTLVGSTLNREYVHAYQPIRLCTDLSGWMNRCMAELDRGRDIARVKLPRPTGRALPLFSVRLHGKGGCCVRESAVEGWRSLEAEYGTVGGGERESRRHKGLQ